MIIIDGTSYDIPIISIKRTADFLDKAAQRTNDGRLHRELIGVYMNYKIQFGRTLDTALYASLWDKLTEPVEYHTVQVPDELGLNYTFQAYFSGVSDEVRKIKDPLVFWKSLTANFIAIVPARK